MQSRHIQKCAVSRSFSCPFVPEYVRGCLAACSASVARALAAICAALHIAGCEASGADSGWSESTAATTCMRSKV
eukprot:6184261-Pleurochrysis_carterae.AAC.1